MYIHSSTIRIRRARLSVLQSPYWKHYLMGNFLLFQAIHSYPWSSISSFCTPPLCGAPIVSSSTTRRHVYQHHRRSHNEDRSGKPLILSKKSPSSNPIDIERSVVRCTNTAHRFYGTLNRARPYQTLTHHFPSHFVTTKRIPMSLHACPLHSKSHNEDNFVDDENSTNQEKSREDFVEAGESTPTNSNVNDHESVLLEPSDEIVIQKTLSWIQNVVIQLNLCPFAEKPFRSSKLFTSVVRGSDEDEIISAILYESILRRDEEGTTVVICPEYFPNQFQEYLHLVNVMEDVLQDYELDSHIQIAPFHPLFEFEGSGKDGLDNWTNRAPYPIFHILREEEVSVAVDKLGGDASKVWKRNINLLDEMDKSLGREDTERAMKGETVKGIQDILRRMRSSDTKV